MYGPWSKPQHQPEPQFLRYFIYKTRSTHFACLSQHCYKTRNVCKNALSLQNTANTKVCCFVLCGEVRQCLDCHGSGEIQRGVWELGSNVQRKTSCLLLTRFIILFLFVKQNRDPRGLRSHPNVLLASNLFLYNGDNIPSSLLPMDQKKT